MSNTQVVQGQPIWPWMQEPFGGWLFSSFYKNGQGNYDMWGARPYPGQLSPDIGKTRLPDVWNAWQPMDAGTMFLGNYLNNGWMASPAYTDRYNNVFQYGGPGGYATDLMRNMAQWGGTGGPGNNAMSLLMQYGAPSQAGQGVSNMAQYGAAGEWGKPLIARATGGQTAASQALAPFLTAPAYRAPTLSAPTTRRRTG